MSGGEGSAGVGEWTRIGWTRAGGGGKLAEVFEL